MSTNPTRDLAELVVPLDRGEASLRALPVAGRLSRRLGMTIRLTTAGGEPAEEWLRAVAAEHLPGMEVLTEAVESDDPVEAIVGVSGDRGMPCMATAASIGLHDGHIGSVAEGVVRTIGRPVLLIGPEMEYSEGSPTHRIICPVDGSKTSEASLPIAGGFAERFKVPLWVVTVLSTADESAARLSLGVDPSFYETGYVRSLARSLAGQFDIDAEYDVLHGDDPAAAIVDFAGDDGSVVMSTHGRSGLRRVFGGSVATGVVAKSKRAVVVYRPDED